MDRLIIVVLEAVLGYFAVDKFVLAAGRVDSAGGARPAITGTDETQASGATAPAAALTPPVADPKPIAVLSFADFSPARDREWFANGLAEKILNALARTPDLLVSARTTSFRNKGSALAIPEIASSSVSPMCSRARCAASRSASASPRS